MGPEHPDLDASFDGEGADSIEQALAETASVPRRSFEAMRQGARILDRYVLEGRLGQGGMGEVWAARDSRGERPVALKLLSLETPEARARFAAEAAHSMALRSPRTVRVLDHGSHDGRPVIVMERVEGRSLGPLLRDDGPLPWWRAAQVAAQVLEALVEAHEHPLRIVHRDIKPDNVMLGPDDAVTVLDFGIARALEGERSTLTRTGHIVGSPVAMAPEQWERRAVTPQTDLYALGCTVHEMLSGSPPFHAPDLAKLGYLHVHEAAPTLDAELAPATLRRWNARLLAKHARERPASAREALGELRRILDPPERLPVALGALPERPYLHLRAFGAAAAPLFFGRERLVHALHQTVVGDERAPLTLVFGPTGVGKSSVLEAGLGPALAATHRVRSVRRDATLGLAGTLRHALGVNAIAEPWRALEREGPLVVMLDQAEEGLIDGEGELDELVEGLVTLFGETHSPPRGGLVLGFRKEWLAEIETALRRVALPFRKVAVPPLGRFELIDAVEGASRVPRLAAHYRFALEDGLADRVVATLLADHRATVAPTLQVLMTKLWDAATPGEDGHRLLTSASFERLAEAGILLEDFLDETLASLERWQPGASASGLALDLLARHTTLAGTAQTLPRARLEALYAARAPEVGRLAARCVDLYLLEGSEGEGTRLAHDTLAPLVRTRFERSDRPGQRALRVLESRAAEWGHGTPVPLDTHDLATVKEGLPGTRAPTAIETEVLAASEAAALRRARARRRLMALGALLLGLIVASAAFAWTERQRALAAQVAERDARDQEQAALHRSRTENLVAAVERAREEDRSRAALLALEALRRHDEVPVGAEVLAEIGMRVRQAQGPDQLPVEVRGFEDNVMTVAAAPDGERFAAAGGRAIAIVGLGGARERTLEGHDAPVSGLCWGPNGLTSVDVAGHLRRWAPSAEAPLLAHAELPGHVIDLACDADHGVAAAGATAVHIVDARSLAVESVPLQASSVRFAADGRLFVAGGAEVSVLTRSGARWEVRRLATWPGEALSELDVLADGSEILVGSRTGAIGVIDVASSPTLVRPLPSLTARVTALAYVDGGARAVASAPAADAAMRIYDLRHGAPPRRFDIGSHAEDIVTDPAGRFFVVAEQRDMVQIFDRAHRDADRLEGQAGLVRLAVDAAGERVLSHAPNHVFRLWRPGSPDPPLRLRLEGLPPNIADAVPASIRSFAEGFVASLGARDWEAVAARVDTNSAGEVGLREMKGRFAALAGRPSLSLASLTASPDGTLAVLGVASEGERHQQVALGLSPARPPRLRALTVSDLPVLTLDAAFGPDGRRVAIATTRGVFVWDLDHPEGPLAALESGRLGAPRALAFDPRDPAGERIAVVTESGGLALWEGPRGVRPAPVFVRAGAVAGRPWGLRFTADGERLVIAGTDGVLVFAGPDDASPRRLSGAPTTALAVSRDDQVAVAGPDASVEVWDLRRPGAPPRALRGHRGDVRGLGFSPDGRRLASASPRGGAVLVWDLEGASAGPRAIHRHVEGPPIDAGLLADGRVVIGGATGWLRVVRPLPEVAADVCRRVRRNLTRDEWRAALGDAPYRLTCER
ncbi:MAG: WD40 repeat domain-containing serine/threonine-protein kinase [Myxococcota bacterium]